MGSAFASGTRQDGADQGPTVSMRGTSKVGLLLNLYIPAIAISFGQGMVVPVVPILASTFGVSTGLAAQVVTAHILGRTLSMIPSGIIVDRVGRKPAMIIGPILIAIGSLGTALTPYFSLLLVAQMVAGAGAGLWQMGRELTAVDLVRAEERGRVMASFFGISHAGITFGPVIGGVITDFVSFKAVFLAYMAMSIAVLAVSLTMKETGKRVRGGKDRGLQWGFGALRSIEPYYRVTFVVLIIATNAAILRSTAVNSILPLYVGTELGYSATAVGSLFGISGLFTLLFIMPAGFVSDKIGRKAAAGPAAALAAVVFLGFSLTQDIFAFSVLAAILGIANAFSMGAMTTYTYDISPEGARGQIQGLRRTSGEVGGIGGPVLGGLIAHLYGPARVFLLFAPLHAVSALLLLFVARESLITKRPKSQQRA